MNKILLTTDDHFTSTNFDKIFEIYKSIVIPTCKENNISTIINLGDFTDKRVGLDAELTYRLNHEFIPLIKDNDIHMYMMLGNHQMYHKDSKTITTLEIFKPHDCFTTIIENPDTIKVNDSHTLLLYPWLLKDEKVKIPSDVNVLLGHFEFIGGYMSPKYQMTSGTDLDIVKGQGLDITLSGHYHIKQELKNNIHYLGTSYQKNRNDYGDRKGIHILHLPEGKKPTIEFIENRISPRFMNVYLKRDPFDDNLIVDIEDMMDIADSQKLWSDEWKDQLKGQYVKVIIDPTIKMTAKIKALLITLSDITAKMEVERTIKDSTTSEELTHDIVNKDIRTILYEVVDDDTKPFLDELLEEVTTDAKKN